MGNNRSRHSCRALLYLVLFAATPFTVRSSTLEDSARELARKIAAALPAPEDASCEIRNISSLRADEVAQVEQALKSELQSRGIHTPQGNGPTAALVVTLSQNVNELVWTAVLRRQELLNVVLLAIPRSPESQGAFGSMSVRLQSNKFWEGQGRILDAIALTPPGRNSPYLFLLTPESVIVQNASPLQPIRVDLPGAGLPSRNPQGRFTASSANIVGVEMDRETCEINLSDLKIGNCAARTAPKSAEISPSPLKDRTGAQVASLHNGCASDSLWIASGKGDVTQPDFLQAFGVTNSVAAPASEPLNFLGPVLGLHEDAGGQTATAIVRNLKSGNYEAHKISITCGQ